MAEESSSVLALDLKDIHKTYGNGTHALKGINLEVAEGDFFALLGPNGAGKSTAISIITSLIRSNSGKVTVFGHDQEDERNRVKSFIGLVPQEFNCNIFEKVEDIIITQAGYYGIPKSRAKPRAEYLLKALELWEKRNSLSRSLSGGMKRRLMIARALMHEPKLLILDEPTAGVDIELRHGMWDFLKDLNKSGTTIILTTHYLEEAEKLCRNIAIIDNGEIKAHTTMAQMLSQLEYEELILTTDEPLQQAPQIENYPCTLSDPHTLVIAVHKSNGINSLFTALTEKQIKITSLQQKTGRLETLYMKLIAKELAHDE